MKTNLILFASLVLLFSASACNKKSSTKVREEPTTEKPTPPKPVEEPAAEAYQVIGFQKTPCFGKCPIYQVKFYSDGKVTWFGKMYVERLGWYDSVVSNEELKRLQEKAQEIGYFDFLDEYPAGTKVADLPSTITYLKIGDKEKQIKNTHDGPDKLYEFQKFLENYIMELKWEPRAEKD